MDFGEDILPRTQPYQLPADAEGLFLGIEFTIFRSQDNSPSMQIRNSSTQ